MAEISNLQESWNGHGFPEVESFIKELLGSSGKKVEVETQGSRFRVNLLDSSGTVLSQSQYVSTTLSNSLLFSYVDAVQSVKLGDKIYVKFFYQVVDSNGLDAQVPASVTVTLKFGTTIKGSITKSVTSNSTTSIDVTDYIESGTTTIEAKVVTDNAEFDLTIYGRINAISLQLSSTFNPKLRFSIGTNLSIPYTLISTSGTKIIEWFVDLSDTPSGTYSTTSNSASATVSIPTRLLESGTHSVLIRAKYNNAGTYIYSNSICFLVALAKDTTTSRLTGFAARFDYSDGTIFGSTASIYALAGLYSLYTLDYFTYDSSNGLANLYIGDQVVATGDSNTSLQYTTKLAQSGDKIIYVYSKAGTESVLVYLFILRVVPAGVQVEEPANPEVILRALNKSNSRADRNTWTYNNVNYATFSNFNWTSDGWQTDSLLIRGLAKLNLNIKPFELPILDATLAMTIIFKIKVTTALDLDYPIISCLLDNRGIKITPLMAQLITSTGNTVGRLFASGLEYEIGFVSHPDADLQNKRMLYIYINGILSGAILRADPQVETIYLSSPLTITVQGEYADVYLYSVSYYKTALTQSDMVNLYLLNINDTETFIDEYTSNNVIDDGGQVTVSSIPDNIPYLILTGQSSDSYGTASTVRVAMRGQTSKPLPRYDIDEILFVNKQLPSKNFKILNGCIRLQGTTTLIYPVKNLRIYSKNSKKEKAQLYLGCDASGQGGTLSDTHKYSFKTAEETASGKPSAPVSCFVLKADCSDSSSTHNIGWATFINKVFIDAGVKTPALKKLALNNYDIRIAVDGFPCYVFYRETPEENPIFLGKFNMINDKGSGEVFGFEDIKGLNNKSDGYRNIGDFKMIRVNPLTAHLATSGLYDQGSWEDLREYAYILFEEVYNNGQAFNNGHSEFDSSGEFIEYNDLGEHVYWDRYGFVYDDDSWAFFYDCSQDPVTGNALWVPDDGEGTIHKHVNPTESWEFATNISNVSTEEEEDSSRVLFTTSDFDTEVDGVAEWTNDFDLRYPDSDDLLEEYTTGGRKPRYLKAVCDWLSGIGDLRGRTDAEVKTAKFKNELENYFNLDNLAAYFCATQLSMGVDLMAKNMMLCFFYDEDATENPIMGKMRGYLLFYDNDTILGLRNDGYLVYNWDLEFDTWDTTQNQYAFAGYRSVLWGNLLFCYLNKIQSMYQSLRELFTLQDILNTFTKLVADKYCERIVNIDMYNKYINPLMEEGKNYLMSLHGTRTSHRTWLINNRLDLFDARYFAGDYKNTIMMLRGGKTETNNTGNVRIVSQRDWYYAVEHESTIGDIKFVEAGGTYRFENDITVSLSLSPQLYGLKYAKVLDLSDFIWNISASRFDGQFPFLLELIYSNYTDTHECHSQGGYCNIGSHAPILKKFVACHLTPGVVESEGSSQTVQWGTLDLQENNFIEEVDVRGSTGITGILLPSGDSLKKIQLSSGLTTINIQNKPNITLATIEGAGQLRTEVVFKNVSNACASMALQLLNKRYAGTHYGLSKVDLLLGTEDDRLALTLTNINDLIRLSEDTTIISTTLTGYAKVVNETIYRYLYQRLLEAFPNFNILCTPSPDEFRIDREKLEIYEGQSTNIYSTGIKVNNLRFQLGKLVNGVFVAEIDAPDYPMSSTIYIDNTYPLAERLSINNEGKLSCGVPHENASWTLDVWIHAYPYYYTEALIANDTYADYSTHFAKVTVKANAISSITIEGLDAYISPNTVYRPTYATNPALNTKYTEGTTYWSSVEGVTEIDHATGLFISASSSTITILLKYTLFGNLDNILTATYNGTINNAVMSDTINSEAFKAFKNGLYNALQAGDFSAFSVYPSPVTNGDQENPVIIHNATLLFTATELLQIPAKAFTYVLKELAKASLYSLSFGGYLTKVTNLVIDSPGCRFGAGLTDIVMPIESITYTTPIADLFYGCSSLLSVNLPNLKSILILCTGNIVNLIFEDTKNQGSNSEYTLSLPQLASISHTSLNGGTITNRMFYGANLSIVSLPLLASITYGSSSVTELMFGNYLSRKTVNLPNLTEYRVGTSMTFGMFSSDIETINIGTQLDNPDNILNLEGYLGMTLYLFTGLSHLTLFNTVNLKYIPGIKTFSGNENMCSSTHELDWSNTKLTDITNGADRFFYKCNNIRKWILPSTIQSIPESSTTLNYDEVFLFGSKIQIVDIRKIETTPSWGDLFKGNTQMTDPFITEAPVKLLFLHIPTLDLPTFSSKGTGLSGLYPVFFGKDDNDTDSISTVLNDINLKSGSSQYYSLYDATSYNTLLVTYNRYKAAVESGASEAIAYNRFPCTWERGVTKNRMFPYYMAKWMSRRVFMTNLNDASKGVSWSVLNKQINAAKNPDYVESDPSTWIEYDLEDITGNMLHSYNFKTLYVDSEVITTWGDSTLMLVFLATGILSLQFPGYSITYNGQWSMTPPGGTALDTVSSFGIKRALLANSNIYNNVNIRAVLDALRESTYSNCTFNLLLYCTGVTEILSSVASTSTMHLTEITLPQSCKTIGAYGLYNTELTKVDNSYSLTSVGNYAFANNNKLTSLLLGSVESLADSEGIIANSKVDTLEFMTLASIKDTTLKDATSLKTYINDCTLTEISSTPYTLSGVHIEKYRFGGLKVVPVNTFKNNTDIKEFSANSCTTIGTEAFSGCTNLLKIEANSLTQLSVTGLLGNQFYNCTKLTNIVMPKVLTVSINCFYNCGVNASVTTKDPITLLDMVTPVDSTFDIEVVTSILSNAFKGVRIASINCDDVEIVANSAFENTKLPGIKWDSLTTVGLDSFKGAQIEEFEATSLEALPTGVFNNCSTLKKLILPGVSTIVTINGQSETVYPFTNCDLLEEVTLGITKLVKSGVSLSTDTFVVFNAGNLATIKKLYLNSCLSIGEGCFLDNSKLTWISLDNCTSIGSNAFKNSIVTGAVTFPELVTLGSYGLYNTKYTSITLPKVTTLGENAMSNNTLLTTVSLATKIIPLECFKNDVVLSQLTTQLITSLGDNSLEGCVLLHNLAFPALTSLGGEVFKDCTGLNILQFGNFDSTGTCSEDCLLGIPSECSIFFLWKIITATDPLDSGEEVNAIYVYDLYKEMYDSIAVPLQGNVIKKITSYPANSEVELDSLSSNFYLPFSKNSSGTYTYLGGDGKVYTYYNPYDAKTKELNITVTGVGFTYEIDNYVIRILPLQENIPGESYKAFVTITPKDGEELLTEKKVTLEIPIPEFFINFKDLNMRDLMLDKYDSRNMKNETTPEGLITLTDIDLITSISFSDSEGKENVKNFKELKFLDKLVTIAENAFKDFTNLEEIELPGNLETIKTGAFENCSSLLDTITAKSNLANIEEGAFKNSSVTKLDLTASTGLNSISSKDSAITEIDLPSSSGLTSIEYGASTTKVILLGKALLQNVDILSNKETLLEVVCDDCPITINKRILELLYDIL